MVKLCKLLFLMVKLR